MFNIILACTRQYGIAYKNAIPWQLPADLKYFRDITKGVSSTRDRNNIMRQQPNVIIMGRKTADTFRAPLPDRHNLVLSSNVNYHYRQGEGWLISRSLVDALELAVRLDSPQTFVIGGAQIITEALKYPNAIDRVYLTIVNDEYECDTFVGDLREHIDAKMTLLSKDDSSATHTYYVYGKNPTGIASSESGYLEILARLLKAPSRQTRNSETRSLFSTSLTFDLSDGFPLLTTRRIFWKGVVNELLFFLGGCSNNKWLKERGVNIWNANTTLDFIQKCGLPYREDDLGPMYGWQWRYYGAPYQNCETNYTGQGRDQFAEVLETLEKDPFSRRILMTSYNYDQVKLGVLAPCHSLVLQFYVEEEGHRRKVSLQMYQRSADIICGVPFNIASNALLLHIIVNILNSRDTQHHYLVDKIHIVFGDYHLYDNHIKQAITQLGRYPKTYPSLKILENINSIRPAYFLNLDPNIFQLHDYAPHPAIKAEMVA